MITPPPRLLTAGQYNARAVTVWALLAMLGLSLAHLFEVGLAWGVLTMVGAALAADVLTAWLLGPPPKDPPR